MIKYDFGIECDISWNKFLCVNIGDKKRYKQEFENFNEFFYFLEHNKQIITKLLFDGYEYILVNGLLHNLYGSAKLRHTEKEDGRPFYGTTRWFYINGKLVSDQQDSIRGCKNEKDFEKNEIFFYEEIINKKSSRDEITGKFYRRKEGVDYIKHYIDLKKLREKDIRKKKLDEINGK